MFYIVGLGNPGDKYIKTRHNVGFLLIDFWQKVFGLPSFVNSSKYSGEVSEGMIENKEVILLKPETFMNNSGVAVKKLVSKDEIKNLVIIYDDVDLPLGDIKVSVGRGDGGHNGIKSIVNSLGSKDFIRLRIGIAPKSFWTGKPKRPVGDRLSKHVLGEFKKRDEDDLAIAKERAKAALLTILKDGVESAMNKFN